jgi:hypothetical protein
MDGDWFSAAMPNDTKAVGMLGSVKSPCIAAGFEKLVSNDRGALDCRHARGTGFRDRRNLLISQKQLIGFSALSGM